MFVIFYLQIQDSEALLISVKRLHTVFSVRFIPFCPDYYGILSVEQSVPIWGRLTDEEELEKHYY